MDFKNRMDFVCQPASQPYVRPGCARCTAPEIQHSKGSHVAFIKLIRRQFTHCAMMVLLSFLSLLSSLSIGMRKQFQHSIQGVSRNNNVYLLFYYIDKFINCYMAEGISVTP